MDIPEDLYQLYAEYGITAEKAQVLETEAGNVALAFVALFVGTDNFDDDKKKFYSSLIEDVNRSTFGKLLTNLRKLANFDQAIIDVIDDALEKRNYLAHHFFRTHNFAIFGEPGRKEMIEELRDIQQRFALAHGHLYAISSILHELSGLPMGNPSELIEQAKKLKI